MPVSTPTLPEHPATQDVSGAEHDLITRRLAQTRWQVKFVDLCTNVATLFSAILAYLLLLSLIDHWLWGLTVGQRFAALVLMLGAVCWFFVRRVLPPLIQPVNPVFAAHTIEQAAPELKNSLVNLLTLGKQRAAMRGMIYDGLRKQAEGRLAQVPPDTLVDRSGLIRVGYTFVALLAIAAAYKILSPKDPFQSIARVAAPWQDIDRPARVQIHDLSPGNDEVYRGETVSLVARITGLRDDEQPTIFYTTEDGQFVNQALELKRGAGSAFHAILSTSPEGIQQSLTYQLRAGDAVSPVYRILAKDAPSIVVRQLKYEYPRYTGLSERVVSEPLDIDAIEGTRIHFEAEANATIRQAYLELFAQEHDAASDSVETNRGAVASSAKPQILPMKVDGSHASATYVLSLKPDRTTPNATSYQVRFTTDDGELNPYPVRHRIEVRPDLSPEVEFLRPRERDLQLPADRSLMLEVRALDPDFAVVKLNLAGTVGGKSRLDSVLSSEPASGQLVRNYSLNPQRLGLKPGDALIYWAEVTDNRHGPNGGADPNVARTESYRVRIVAPQGPTAADQNSNSQESGQQNGNETPQAGGEQAGDPANEGGEQGGEPTAESSNEPAEGQAGNPSGEPAGDNSGRRPEEKSPSEGNQQTGEQQSAGEEDAGDQQSGAGVSQSEASDGGNAGSEPQDHGHGEQQGEQRGGPEQPGGSEVAEGQADSDAVGGATATHEPIASDGSNDADAFERILQRMKERSREERSDKGQPESREHGDQAGEGDASSAKSGEMGADPPDANAQESSDRKSSDRNAGEETGNDQTPEDGRQPNGGRASGDLRKPSGVPGDEEREAGGKPQGKGGTGAPDRSGVNPKIGGEANQRGDGKTGESAEDDATDNNGVANDSTENPSGGEGEGSASRDAGAEKQAGSPDKTGAGVGKSTDESADTDPRTTDKSAASDSSLGKPAVDSRNEEDASSEFNPRPDGTGQRTSRQNGSGPSTGDVAEPAVPEDDLDADEANLEFARKATDLALDYLKNQPEDRELLDDLQWTPEEMAAFVRRWEQLRRAAQRQNPDSTAKRHLDEQLRGLGLRPQAARVRAARSTKDPRGPLRQSGGDLAVPPEYLDQYRAFLKSAAE